MNLPRQDITQLVRGAGISIFGKVIGRGLNFIGQVIVARLLDANTFGLYSIGWTVLRLIGLIAPLGLDQGIIHFGIHYYRTDPKKFQYVFRLAVGLALIAGCIWMTVVFQYAAWIASVLFGKPGLEIVLKVFAISFPFAAGLRVLSSATTITKSTNYSMISEEIGQPAMNAFFLLLIIATGGTLLNVLWVVVISFAAALVLAGYYALRLFPASGHAPVVIPGFPVNLIAFSIPVAFASLLGSLINWIDRIMVGIFLSESNAGIYSIVSLIAALFVTILSGVKVIFAPLIADLLHQDEIKRVEEMYRVSTKWALYISIPPALLIFFGAKDFLNVVFGPAYAVGFLSLIVLVAAQIVNIGTGALDLLFIMSKRNRMWLAITGAAFVFCVILNVLLIPRFGILGASVGTGITVVGMSIFGLLVLKNQLNVFPYDRRFIKGFLATGFTIFALAVLNILDIGSPVTRLILLGITAFLSFGGCLFLLQFDQEDKEVFRMVRARLHRLNSQEVVN